MNNKIQNIEEISSLLQNLIPEARIAVAHGRLNGKTLESLMIKFINREFDVLVSTTIIAVSYTHLTLPTIYSV